MIPDHERMVASYLSLRALSLLWDAHTDGVEERLPARDEKYRVGFGSFWLDVFGTLGPRAEERSGCCSDRARSHPNLQRKGRDSNPGTPFGVAVYNSTI
jgi:hypothetical protein